MTYAETLVYLFELRDQRVEVTVWSADGGPGAAIFAGNCVAARCMSASAAD